MVGENVKIISLVLKFIPTSFGGRSRIGIAPCDNSRSRHLDMTNLKSTHYCIKVREALVVVKKSNPWIE